MHGLPVAARSGGFANGVDLVQAFDCCFAHVLVNGPASAALNIIDSASATTLAAGLGFQLRRVVPAAVRKGLDPASGGFVVPKPATPARLPPAPVWCTDRSRGDELAVGLQPQGREQLGRGAAFCHAACIPSVIFATYIAAFERAANRLSLSVSPAAN